MSDILNLARLAIQKAMFIDIRAYPDDLPTLSVRVRITEDMDENQLRAAIDHGTRRMVHALSEVASGNKV